MRRHRWVQLSAALLLICGLAKAERLPVVVSFSILGDLVQQVGGDQVSVTALVGPDQDAHVFQPAPKHAALLGKARLVVVNGLGFDDWLPRLATAAHYQGALTVASKGVQTLAGEEHGVDPHAWQDPARVRQYVQNIEQALSKVDPAHAAYYRQRSSAYQQRLQVLEQWALAAVGKLPAARRKVITSHDAFGYLAQRFGITFLAPQGMNTDAEATPKAVARLIEQIRQQQVKAVFVENISNPRLLQQLASEAGVKPGGKLYSDALSAASGPAASYEAMFRYNLSQLLAAM
ncbi:metal ABC transporter substrate-binding protein [Leeia aquatica]|uniref:Metal ABC transporter substrate-binding protein n=1 Tax=Leeia aquatica TaxID=2725557 RepID=A0A847SB99_9NEIS|nr:metal ABC transporter substrate-binding protein [Leeia aquatica]NLR76175.1 metal ABC transporter substrate-binding protein [Leeia aquatica]